MFGKKYVFESKTTRLKRILEAGGIVSFFSFALVVSFLIYIPIYAKMQKGRAAGAFFERSPDAIAVFTGDKGRISYALELLRKNPSAKLFISGVHAANSFRTLIVNQAESSLSEEMLSSESMQIDLDYESKNTLENVRETVKFLRSNPQFQNVLIISSDYHIMRIRLIISHLLSDTKTHFFFDSVITHYNSWNDVRKLLLEGIKISRTYLILKIFREDVLQED